MSKTIFKRMLPFLLAVLLTAGLAACGSSGDNGGNGNAPSKDSGAGAADGNVNTDPMGVYAKPVSMNWAIQTAAASKLLDGDTWADNRWSRLIKDKLNIDLKVAFTADSSTDAYKNKLNAVIASGDLPDVFKTQDDNVFLQLAENGQLADLTDVFNQYATDSIKAYMEKYPDSFKGATVNGKLYAIPRMNDNFHEAPFLWIRDDWLKRTNSEPPKTVDDMIALAKKFATGDPDGNGINGDTYGLALNKDLIRQNHGSILGLVSAFGVPARDETEFYRDGNGKMTFAWIQPNVKKALAVLADMYKQGLINKEFTAKNESALVEDITNGKIGMAYGSNWGTWYPYNNVWKKDHVIVHPYPIPTVPGIDYKIGIESNLTGQMTMVSATYKHPEALIKILNLYDQTVDFSTDSDYQKYWANEQYRLSPVYIDLPSELTAPSVLKALDTGSTDGLSSVEKINYNYVKGFEAGSMKNDDNAFGIWGQMSKEGSLPIVLNRYEPDHALVQSVLGIKRPDVWMTNVASLDTLTITTFTDIITGTKPVDAFDTFVQQWLKAGGQQTLDEMDKLYPAK